MLDKHLDLYYNCNCKVNLLYGCDFCFGKDNMEKNLKNNLLLDFYGNMLTDKQKQIMSLYFDCDSSLSEIADELKTSRQAVYDAVKVSQNLLNSYEEKLKCVERFLSNRAIINEVIEDLNAICDDSLYTEKVQKTIKKLQKVLKNQ